jgi:hypothetical protein
MTTVVRAESEKKDGTFRPRPIFTKTRFGPGFVRLGPKPRL